MGSALTVIAAGQPAVHMPVYSGEVYDVTGAGDTVIAVLTAALANGIELVQAVHLCSVAAAIVVSKVGTSSVTMHELRHSLVSRKSCQ